MNELFHPFGLCLAGAIVVALGLSAWSFRKAKLSLDALSWIAVLGVPLGVIFARVAYFLANYDQLAEEGAGFLMNFSRGGFMLYGAVIGVLLATAMAARLTKTSFARLADGLCVPGLVMIALGRLAIGLTTGQDYGWCIEDWFMEDSGMSCFVLEDPSFLYRLPFGVPDYYENYNWAVFVFEALVALGLAMYIGRTKTRRPGDRLTLTLVCYASAQVLCESLRQDAVLRWGFVRINQVVAAVLIAALLLVYCLKLPKKSGKTIALSWAGIIACMGVVMAMEFALEKKISAIEFVPMDVCYLVMALACLGMIAIFRKVWRKSDVTEE